MQMLAIPLQTETRPDEGLALTWFEVPGAIRYGLIIGVPGAPMPDLDVIMRGQTQQFAIVGVPSRFTGAVDIGTPTGETRQFGMVAYRNDGEILAVPSLQIHPARSAPRDREYHAVVPPALVDPNPPASPPQPADPNDPWSALEAGTAAGRGPVTTFAAPTPPVAAPSFTLPSPSTSPTTAHSPAPYDPWDVLSQPAAAPEAAAPASVPAPIPTARYEAVAAQLPVEPAPLAATPAPETPAEAALHLESPVVVPAAESAAPISSTLIAEPLQFKTPEPIAPMEAVGPEALTGSGIELKDAGALAPPTGHPAVASEVSDRQAEPLVEPEPASIGISLESENTAATAPEMSESPAIEVTPPATWERGFAVPPEIPHEEPAPPVAEPPISAAPPVLSAPPAVPAPPAPPLSAELAAVLDEAELYLLPQWADPEAARRLLEQAEREAPEHPRVRDLRARLEAAGGGDNSVQIAGLLEQADRSMNDRDYWTAVDYYEQILAEQPEHEGALAGLAKARLRARWPTRLAGASGDATALRALGDDAAAEMPDLAGQAYAAAFAIQPGVEVLRGWLIAFVHAGHGEVLAGTARRAVNALEEKGTILPTPAAALALDRLEQAAANGPAATEPAVHHLCDTLASAVP